MKPFLILIVLLLLSNDISPTVNKTNDIYNIPKKETSEVFNLKKIIDAAINNKKIILDAKIVYKEYVNVDTSVFISYENEKRNPQLSMRITERACDSDVILVCVDTDEYGEFKDKAIIIKLENNLIIHLSFYNYIHFVDKNKVGALFKISNNKISFLNKSKIKSIKINMDCGDFTYKKIKEPEFFINALN